VLGGVRWWDSRAALAANGVDFDSKAIARSAMRSARASDALAAYTAHTWATRGDHADLSPLGYATLDWPWLCAQPEDIRLRLLSGLINAIGGQTGSVSLGQLEDLTGLHAWSRLVGTLHGTQISTTGPLCTIAREWGRNPLPELELRPGATTLWDRRFELSLSAEFPHALRVACFGSAGEAMLITHAWPIPRPRGHILHSQPALWDNTTLIAAPTLGYVAAAWRGTSELVRCRFQTPVFAAPSAHGACPSRSPRM
jgi:hypothetical protein